MKLNQTLKNQSAAITTVLLCMLMMLANADLAGQEWKYGPLRNQAQLNAGLTGGEGGQWPQALAVSQNGSMVMLGTDVAGMVRSENGGNIWKQANAGYNPRGNCGIAIDPNNINKILAVGGNSVLELSKAAPYHGIYLSTDKGISWSFRLGANLCGFRDIREQITWDPGSYDPAIGGSRIAYWSRADSTYCQSSNQAGAPGLYKSTDGGENWTLIPGSAAYGQSIVKVNPDNGTVYIANKNGFFRSTDGGLSFTHVITGNVTGMDVIPTKHERVYISTPSSLLLSTDSGFTFKDITGTSFPANAVFIKVSPADPKRMMVQSIASKFVTPWYYSHNGGKNWTQTVMDNSLDYLPFNSGRKMYPVWHPTDASIVWSVGGDWVTQSTDGGATLKWKNNGSSMICQTGYFAFSNIFPNTVAVTTQDYCASITSNGGASWKYLKELSPNPAKTFGFAYGGYALNTDTLFVRRALVSRGATNIFISFDGGETFMDKGAVAGEMTGYSDPLDRKIFFLGNKKSVDGGNTWTEMAGCSGVFLHNLSNPSEIFGVNNSTKYVVRSLDHGQVWENVFPVGSAEIIRDIAYDQINDIFYAVTEFNFYQYKRITGTRVTITGRTPGDQFFINGVAKQYRTVAVDPVNTSIVYVGNKRDLYATDVAICRSVDTANSFIPLTHSPRHGNHLDGIDAGREVQCIRVHPITREAWVGCGTYGLWRIPAPPGSEMTVTGAWAPVTAVQRNDMITVSWNLKGHTDISRFEIEYAAAGGVFKKIAAIPVDKASMKANSNFDIAIPVSDIKGTPGSGAALLLSVPLFMIWVLRRRDMSYLMAGVAIFCITISGACRKMSHNPAAGDRIRVVGYDTKDQRIESNPVTVIWDRQ